MISFQKMKKHIGIFSKSELKKIFSGELQSIVHLSKKRIHPFGVVSLGDLVYTKPPGEEIVGQFIIKKVIFFEGLEKNEWDLIKKITGEEFLKERVRFATIIFIDQVEKFITSPIKFSKSDQRAWVVLN